jgi:hypothetical protein
VQDDLDGYREQAERFLEQHDREYLEHFSGLKASYEVGAIFERHAPLFADGAIATLRERWLGAAKGSEEARRLRWLMAFAVEGRLGQDTRELDEELAPREASTTLALPDGLQIGLREAPAAQMNEPDAARRADIEAVRLEATTRELTPLHRARWERSHAVARELGWTSYRALWQDLMGVDLGSLAGQCEAFLAATDADHAAVLDGELRRTTGAGLDSARRSEVPRWLRDVEADVHYPAGRLLAAFEQTLSGLGLALSDRSNVLLDLEPRPTKSPRAFCAPVRVPAEVYLVVPPMGGRDDYSALFHEGGHAHHYGAVDGELAFEFRRLGDNAITEAFAFLFERLADDEAWLSDVLGVAEPEPLARRAGVRRLYFKRRYAAKLGYELELHEADGPLDLLAPAYARRLSRAAGLPWPRATFLEDVDPAFYVACYLRAWALEARLRRALHERFGARWFAREGAGAWLRDLFRDGQRSDPDELAHAVDGAGALDFAALAGDDAKPSSPASPRPR